MCGKWNCFTAVVHAPDGVRFVASSSDEADVTTQLVGYVSERCYDTLWPAAARAVHALIDAGRGDEAVATYFANVGQRWDEERLESVAVRGSDAEILESPRIARIFGDP